MFYISDADFIRRFCVDFPCLDHHFSGPEANHQVENHGSVFKVEGKILAGLAAKLGGPILEIGADQGISTRYLHEGLMRHPGGPRSKIYSVDCLHKWADDPKWPLRVRVVADSGDFTPPVTCRWAFIDGDHRYPGVTRDIASAVRTGCTAMMFHDTAFGSNPPTNASNGTEARKAAQDHLSPAIWELYDVGTHCGMIYAVKKGPPPQLFCDPSAGLGNCCDGAAL